MAYVYRVTLSGIKGFFRVYKMSPSSTLYALHKQMRADMEFPVDQPILFKALNADGQPVARYDLFGLCDAPADQVSVAQTVKQGITSFIYFYDIPGRKSVIVTFEGETPEPAGAPALTDSKGPDPIDFENGYVAFEDLPVEERHLPEEEPSKKANPLAGLLDALDDIDDDDEDEDDEDADDEEDEDEDDRDEDTVEYYDGSEELTL